ncbi:MAG TPA: tetratricopeptide repeat protein [Verrucomicrobiae bacterium]|nr:tetratricopeptide repeat protein [Verrucomicrobiae bacterium]
MRRTGFRAAVLLTIVSGAPGAEPARVTFNGKIAPIIYQNCAPCHRPGESAPFSLLSYADVKRRAAQIADVTKRRYMPPWLPEPGHGEFADERRLSDPQLQLIQDWVKQGAVEGAERPPRPPKFADEWQMGTPDLILRASQPYQLAADGQEIFWNFIMPVPITTTRWVKAIEVRPGNARAFHHANVIIDRARSSRRRERTPGAGFPGMDIIVEEETFDPDGHFLSWKPGSPPVVEPDGMAWRAEPGMDLVLNVHLRPTGKPETVSPMIGLYFTAQPQKKYPLLVQLEHDQAIDIPPGESDFQVGDDFQVPLDMNVLAIYPHAHYLGKLMEGYATLPDGSRKWLIRIPNWDLSWQGVFRFRQPVFLPRGSVVSMRYHYDNSAGNVRNPNNPPKEVKAGNQATDEMSHMWLQVLPAADRDQRAAVQESVARQRIEKDPENFTANYTLGDLMMNQGNAVGAIPYFTAAVKADPGSVIAATELGVALFTGSRLPEAKEQFRRALQLDPGYTDARFDLASAEAASEEWENAANDFRQVLKERPGDSKAQEHLGEVLFLWGNAFFEAGKDEPAAERYREALSIRPNDAELHARLGVSLGRLGRLPEAEAELQAALKIDPTLDQAKRALAIVQARMKGK